MSDKSEMTEAEKIEEQIARQRIERRERLEYERRREPIKEQSRQIALIQARGIVAAMMESAELMNAVNPEDLHRLLTATRSGNGMPWLIVKFKIAHQRLKDAAKGALDDLKHNPDQIHDMESWIDEVLRAMLKIRNDARPET